MKKWQVEVKMPDGSVYVVKTLLGKGDSNHKLAKSDKAGRGYMTVGLSLAPAKLSGFEMCRGRSKGCTAACLNTAGRGQQTITQRARIAKIPSLLYLSTDCKRNFIFLKIKLSVKITTLPAV
jgi:hypothetical protein